MINDSIDIRRKVYDFLDRYGDKGYLVLKTALDIALDPDIDHRLGDFNYKNLVFRLAKLGVNYNPQNLIRILEREYGLIEKTYVSTTQKWWSFVDTESIRKALYEYSGSSKLDDPRLRLLLIKYRSLEPMKILNDLRRLASKENYNNVDKELFRKIVFEKLEPIIQVYVEMMSHEDVFKDEIRVLEEIISIAEHVSNRIDKKTHVRERIMEKTETWLEINEDDSVRP